MNHVSHTNASRLKRFVAVKHRKIEKDQQSKGTDKQGEIGYTAKSFYTLGCKYSFKLVLVNNSSACLNKEADCRSYKSYFHQSDMNRTDRIENCPFANLKYYCICLNIKPSQ